MAKRNNVETVNNTKIKNVAKVEKSSKSVKAQKTVADILCHTLLIIMAVVWIFPFVYLVLQSFRGEIMQIPPMYSALKVNGQKLCDLARKGRTVERQPRPITIHELTLLDRDAETLRLRVRCSKGTYIRTLCKDIGEALGCGGCMQELRRVTAGEYTIEEAVPLQELLDAEQPEQYLRHVDTMFRNFPSVTLTENQEKRCRNGNPFSMKLPDGIYRAYGKDGSFLMLAKMEEGTMSTVKSFFEVAD